MWNKYFILMGRLKKILDSWNILRHRMRNQDEVQEVKAKPSFPTDDTVMTLAVAKWLTIDQEHTHEKLVECMKELG